MFDIDSLIETADDLERLSATPDFWDDREAAQAKLKRLSSLRSRIQRWQGPRQRLDDLMVLAELASEEQSDSVLSEIESEAAELSKDIEKLQLQTLLSGEYDRNGAILSIHPGAGGTESQDWAQMLLRMYTRYAEQSGYEVTVLDLLPGEEAGIKSATLEISGEYAYGYLRSEKGVHRLVRISPFDANARRHTSFASVDVMPVIEDDGEIEISPADLRIDTFRSGGAGGQHVNKTDSAVRITHLPTGIVVQCQNERSQHSNRLTAMRILRAKLAERKQAEMEERLGELRGDVQEIAWGNQIRSYVFHPYNMVKDHRTQVETGNVSAVMDGDIAPFIEAYLRWRASSHNSDSAS
ncbi:MAG: peptide chain release factor 2 [Firmicutes bacterium]|nr:peptide chain release factor 2 [Bacillota bacterium]